MRLTDGQNSGTAVAFGVLALLGCYVALPNIFIPVVRGHLSPVTPTLRYATETKKTKEKNSYQISSKSKNCWSYDVILIFQDVGRGVANPRHSSWGYNYFRFMITNQSAQTTRVALPQPPPLLSYDVGSRVQSTMPSFIKICLGVLAPRRVEMCLFIMRSTTAS